MRCVIQRVKQAKVVIKDNLKSSVNQGMLILLGIEEDDTERDIGWLVKKITALRIFNDENGVMNLSVKDIGGDILVVSQFTLHADLKKGNRPSYHRAAKAEKAVPLYESFIRSLQEALGRPVGTGSFGAVMEVSLVNDGPVTITIDTKEYL
jgi:D-tyrosyl-tRNA(Tyr) deacylase